MLPDDVFRAQLRNALTTLRAWAAAFRDDAHIEETETSSYWRISATPVADNACAFELIAHTNQRFDLLVGPETYEQCALEDTKLLVQLVDAMASGRVTTRTWSSRNTDLVRSIETIIDLPDAVHWRREHIIDAVAGIVAADDCVARDQRYAPYRHAE